MRTSNKVRGEPAFKLIIIITLRVKGKRRLWNAPEYLANRYYR